MFANSISNLYTKRLPQNSYQEYVRYTSSVALCAAGTSVTLHYLRPLPDSVCLLYKTFSLSLHISEEPKNKILHNCTPSKILTVKNESVLEYAFPTFIPISLIFYNKRNPKYESSCHSCHKRTAYNLLTYSRFT